MALSVSGLKRSTFMLMIRIFLAKSSFFADRLSIGFEALIFGPGSTNRQGQRIRQGQESGPGKGRFFPFILK